MRVRGKTKGRGSPRLMQLALILRCLWEPVEGEVTLRGTQCSLGLSLGEAIGLCRCPNTWLTSSLRPRYVNHLFLTVQHGVTMALTNSSTLDSLFLSTAAKEAAFDWLNSMTVQRMSYPEYYQSIWAVVLPSFFAFIALWFSSIAVIVALVADMVSCYPVPRLYL